MANSMETRENKLQYQGGSLTGLTTHQPPPAEAMAPAKAEGIPNVIRAEDGEHGECFFK